MTITSSHNDKLKEIRRLARRRARDEAERFVAEGEDLVAAAAVAGWSPELLLAAAGSGLDGEEVEPSLLASLSGLGSGTRQLGVYRSRWAPSAAGPLCVALWGVGDPGNVGTIVRAALAFGASSVALGPGCADPFGPKAVRASMGAIFAVPVARVASAAQLPGERIALVAHGGEPLALVAKAGESSRRVAQAGEPPAAPVPDADGGRTLLVGAERSGLPADVVAGSERVARIPIAGESLNAAMAATVALYELTSRRESHDG